MTGAAYYSAKKRFAGFIFTCQRCGAQSVKRDTRGNRKYCRQCRHALDLEQHRKKRETIRSRNRA